MIPISDDNPTIRTPVITWALLAALFAVWLTVQGGGMDLRALAYSVCDWGLVPAELTGGSPLGTAVPLEPRLGLACVVDDSPWNIASPVTSMFLHGSWAHLLGNALFLWVFGNNIEDGMGPARFIVFYLACGLVAAAAHIVVTPASAIPTVGASGAISGVMGAYLVLYPRVRVNMLFWFLIIIRIIPLPAWVVLIYWFVVQVVTGLPQLSPVTTGEQQGGVAVWAHVGGFVAGALLVRLFTRRDLMAQRQAMRLAHRPFPHAH
jgi:membrane associated rhomboid family serine protease